MPVADADRAEPTEVAAVAAPSLANLPIVGLTRRRLAWIVAALVAGWILFTFARQVGEAADATARAERVRAENATVSAELERLTAELTFIQDPRFVAQQARAYGIGTRKERPFTLAADASPVPVDAPGSDTRRIGYREVVRTPLEAWGQLLFGSGPER
jgi:hypothetical protein